MIFYYFHHEREKWSLERLNKICARSCQFFKEFEPMLFWLQNLFPEPLFSILTQVLLQRWMWRWRRFLHLWVDPSSCFYFCLGLMQFFSSCDFGGKPLSTWNFPLLVKSWPVEFLFRFHSFFTALSSSSFSKESMLELGGGRECSGPNAAQAFASRWKGSCPLSSQSNLSRCVT